MTSQKCFEHFKSLQLKKVYACIDAFINMNGRHAGIVFLIAIDIVKPIVSTITYLLLRRELNNGQEYFFGYWT
jgi:hypothetical protein